MSPNATRNVQTAIVLFGTLAAWVFVPHELIRPVSLALLAFAVVGVFAARAYLRRLHEVVTFLESTRHSNQPSSVSALLTGPERQFLRLGPLLDGDHAIDAIRNRQSFITAAGTFLGILGIGAFLVTLIAFAD